MRRAVFMLLAAGTVLAVGCMWNKSKKHDLSHPKVECYDPPPNEARYNNPPEEKFHKPPVAKDLASRPGAGGGPMMMNPTSGPGGR
jgi:hypothetical protein